MSKNLLFKASFKFPRLLKRWSEYNAHERTLIILAILGMISIFCAILNLQDIKGLIGNFSAELGGAVITYLLIDRMIGIKEVQEEVQDENQHLRAKLVRQLSASDRKVMQIALSELRDRGWLADGWLVDISLMNINLASEDLYKINCRHSDLELARFDDSDMYLANLESANLCDASLRRTRLQRANLKRANLWSANLQGAMLNRADLHCADLRFAKLQEVDMEEASVDGAFMQWANLAGVKNLTDVQLSQAWALQGATMPDGYRYNGRFNLRGDILEAVNGNIPTDPDALAEFYGVTVQDYQRGQLWARQNLRMLPRSEDWPDEERLKAVINSRQTQQIKQV